MKLSEGQKLAEEILKILKPLCEQIEVAGSIRRQRPEVKDIDIVLVPKPLVDIVGVLQRKLGAKVEKKGSRIISLKINNIGVDLNLATKENFAPLLLFRTGSWKSNMRLATKAKQMGLKFSPYGVFRGDKRIDSNTEESIFEVLGEDYVPPEERD